MSYTTQEEETIEGLYADFFSANIQEAATIIEQARSLEYYPVVKDMERILADKKLRHA